MKNAFVIGLICFALFAQPSRAAAFQFPRSSPEEQGVSSEKLLKFVEKLDSQIEGMHSLMILRHGKVIAEGWWTPYRSQDRHTMYSLSKSFASTAVGIAQAEGKLSIDDTVISFFPDLTPENASPQLKAMRVRDLLAMSTGHHDTDIAGFDYRSEDAVKRFLSLPVAHKPGTHFMYNTPASFMLSAIVHKVTGQNLVEYLTPRLFEPLGIENPVWDAGKTGVSLGGFGLHIRTEDIARFGQLYLQKGDWRGKKLLTRDWVAAASARQTSNGSNPKSDWDQGYGYQFWRCRNGAFRGDGAFGQYCVVFPEQDAVLAITSGVRDMQSVLNITWDDLLPALNESGSAAKNSAAASALKEKLASLKMRPVSGRAYPQVDFHKPSPWNVKFDANDQKLESISLEDGKGSTTLTARINGKDFKLVCEPGKWRPGTFTWEKISSIENLATMPAAATGAWDGNVFTAKIAFTETPFVLTLRLSFTKEKVVVDPEFNVAFGSAKRASVTGILE